MSDKKNYNSLTFIRAFLALWVVLAHFGFGDKNWFYGVTNIFNHPSLAVSGFFVLSGFVMALNYSKFFERGDVVKYYISRVARIYPIYIIAVLLCTPIAFHRASGFNTSFFSGFFVEVFMLQGWVSNNLYVVWNEPGWSLSCEAFFYLTFPFIINILISRGLVFTRIIFSVSLLASAIYGVLIISTLSGKGGGWQDVLVMNPVLRFSEFLLGVCGAMIYANRIQYNSKMLFCVGACGVLSIGFVLPSLIPTVGIASVFWLMCFLGLMNYSIPNTGICRLFLAVGESSYSLYILHLAVSPYYKNIFKFVTGLSDLKGSLVYFTSYLVFILFVSFLSHRFFEMPVRNFVLRRFKRS